jgi:RNA polymerase sigma-70 factor (ECF subfamily)
MGEPAGDVTLLLQEVARGNQEALARLMPLVYAELRRLAAHCMRNEHSGHTLQPTALVHEAYVRLTGRRRPNWQNKAHFFAVAAQAMRRVLVDHARSHLRQKRGAGDAKVSLDEVFLFTEAKSEELLALDQSLDRLAALDPRQSRVIEMRFFGGLEVKEIAGVLDISEKTVKRDWQTGKLWLHGELRRRDGTHPGEMATG